MIMKMKKMMNLKTLCSNYQQQGMVIYNYTHKKELECHSINNNNDKSDLWILPLLNLVPKNSNDVPFLKKNNSVQIDDSFIVLR